jgi:hypothetical protein
MACVNLKAMVSTVTPLNLVKVHDCHQLQHSMK